MNKNKQLANIWRPFTYFPSLFEETNEFFPDIGTFSNEKGLSVSEDNGTVLVEASVPGLKPEDIEISLDEGTLWIKGEKTEEKEDKKRKYYHKASSSYSYCTSLPENVDLDKEPQARSENGVVKIEFKKKKSTKPKKIAVKKIAVKKK
jgi:HSP20 family protein